MNRATMARLGTSGSASDGDVPLINHRLKKAFEDGERVRHLGSRRAMQFVERRVEPHRSRHDRAIE